MKLRLLKRELAPLLYAGSEVFCPICDRSYSKFGSAGRNEYRRPNAVCPGCAGRERDRLIYLFLEREAARLAISGPLLHIAPEACLVTILKRLTDSRYVCGDLFRTDVDLKFDVERLPFRDESFDAVYCSHVLQAVIDDDSALREIHRVLSADGWAILNVPARGEKTVDFRQGGEADAPPDFVRIYGDDFLQKLADFGLNVEVITPADVLTVDEQDQMFVHPDTAGAIFLVHKARDSSQRQ